MAKKKSKAVSNKIAKLRREGKSAAQAAAIAYDMSRKNRLGPRGGYKREGKNTSKT